MKAPGTIGARVREPSAVDGVAIAGVARGSLLNLCGAAVGSVVGFVLTVAVTRALPRPDAGVFFTATSIFLLTTTVGQLGTGNGLVYFIARCRATGTPELVRHYLRAAAWPVLALGVLLGLAMFVLAPQVAGSFSGDHVDEGVRYLRTLAFCIPFVGLENLLLAATRGLGTMKVSALVEQMGRPVVQLLLVVAALMSPSATLLMLGWSLAYVPATVAGWLWWRRLRPHQLATARPAGLSRSLWWFSGPRSVATVAQLAMQRLDVILVGALAGPAEAALYAAATRFIVVGQMTRNAVSQAFQPHLAEALAREDHDRANELYQTTTAWLMLVTWPLYLLLSLFAGSLLGVFGEGYAAATGVVVVLALSMLVATACGDVDMVLTMAGRTSWSMWNAMIALAVQVSVDVWLIPRLGVMGAAIGWGVAITVKNVSPMVQVALVLRLHPVGAATLTTAGLSLLGFGVVPLLVRAWAGQGAAAGATALLIGGGCFLLGVWRARRTLRLDAAVGSLCGRVSRSARRR